MGYSIWLNFDDQCSAKLKNKIETIARRNSCPEFTPHLTLLGDIDLELPAVRNIADKFIDGVIPPKLKVRRVDSSNKYFMALYLAVDIPPELRTTRNDAAELAGAGRCNLDDPHVSLAYGKLEQSELLRQKKSLTEEFLDKDLRVGDVSIVYSSKSVPIAEWKPLVKIVPEYRKSR